MRAEGPAATGPGPAARAWESQPNAEFRNRLAIAEGNAGRKDFGYGTVNERTGALGRYQISPVGLRAAGMIDGNGHWTGKYGVHSRAEFLSNPEAQEKTLPDYLHDIEHQLKVNGAFKFIGASIEGLISRFTVTRAGLIAAGHPAGAAATKTFLQRIEANGFNSRGPALDSNDLAIETQLRTFANTPYE